MIPVKVHQVMLSSVGFVVLLKGKDDERALPIFVGAAEAQTIALCLNHVKIPRPLTHDLLKNVLDYLECRVRRVEVNELREGTFYARLVLERDGVEMPIDARPSDAIALSLRAGAPIYVDAKVMNEAGRVFDEEAGAAADRVDDTMEPPPAKREETKKDTPLVLLKKKLEQAVREERYEDAARLRDEIKTIEGSHGGN